MRALIFDLDGTLIDTVYADVFSWQRVFWEAGLPVDGWRIHRRMGMSGGLFTCAAGASWAATSAWRKRKPCSTAMARSLRSSCPTAGRFRARWNCCSSCALPASCTASPLRESPGDRRSLDALGIDSDTVVVERGECPGGVKPEPDLFLACQQRMGVRPEDCYVVGDAVWDLLAARRAGMLSIGLLSGGYGEDELTGLARSGSTVIQRNCSSRSTNSGYCPRRQRTLRAHKKRASRHWLARFIIPGRAPCFESRHSACLNQLAQTRRPRGTRE